MVEGNHLTRSGNTTVDQSKSYDTESVEQVKGSKVGVAVEIGQVVNVAQKTVICDPCSSGDQMEYDHTYFKKQRFEN